jgi:hypothetical protein
MNSGSVRGVCLPAVAACSCRAEAELFAHVWPQQFVGADALERGLREARKAIGDRGSTQQIINTVRGRGYRFVAAVQERLHSSTIDDTLAGAPPPIHAASQPAAPPPDLTKTTLTTQNAPAGERKQVPVLCRTLANVTALAEALGPEAMHEFMQRFFELAQSEIHRHEGMITEFLGDGFMALFGVPIAQEDHAVRAVHAALGIQRALRGIMLDANFLPGAPCSSPTPDPARQ